jgi:phage terminase large subunit GpA-like protein
MPKVYSIDRRWLDGIEQLSPNFRLRLSSSEKKVLRKRKPIPVSQWAERHRVVTNGPLPGKWKNTTCPYLGPIMDASFFPSVQTVIVCAAPQVGKSELVNTCIGYAVDRRPGSVLYVYPDEQTARENSKDRILPMIESSRRLKGFLTGNSDDAAAFRINLKHLQIYLGWARSASRLANKTLPYVVFDEIDKYPETSGKRESSPIALGEKRTRTFTHMRKIWKLSTPTVEAGPIWQAMSEEAQAIFDFWVRCPFCGASQLMIFDKEHFKFPADCRDPQEIEARDLAWYECEGCKAHWDDDIRNQAVRAGAWRDRSKGLSLPTYLNSHKPQKIGFHIPSWLSYFVGISEICARFLKGTKNKNALKDFNNADEAKPWKLYTVDRSEDRILALCDDRPKGVVPGGGQVAALTAGIDTQDDGFYYSIRAWGWGQSKESWGVREGFVASFEALAQVLWQDEYKDASGKQYLVRLAIQDAMGHRTAEVYEFCRLHRGRILPSKGEQRMNAPHSFTNLEYYPGSKKPIRGGLRLIRFNTTFFKNELDSMLEVSPGDPGAFNYHSELTEHWAQQMTVEYRDEKGFWQNPKNRANHGWDCETLNLVGYDVLGVRHWAKPKVKDEKAEQPETGPQKIFNQLPFRRRPQGGWMGGIKY